MKIRATFDIESDIPIQRIGGKERRYPYFPLAELEVGQSFLIPASMVSFKPHPENGRPINKLIAVVGSRARPLHGKKFTCRTMEDKSLRVWRVK